MPICIESCPVRALDAGNFDDLKEKYGSILETEGFKYSKRTDPAVVFKPKLK
jgi:anaerobic dimethyl sulfoxide reductase subunit B (iron-sulfur subunit)